MKTKYLMLLCVALTCGCIKVQQHLVLNRDGSGTLSVKYSVPEQTVTQIKAMLKLERELAMAAGESPETFTDDQYTRLVFDPDEDRMRKKLAAFSDCGISVDELAVKSRSARRNVDLKVSFSNIADLAKADFFAGYGFSLIKAKDGNYVWIHRGDRSNDSPPPDVSDAQTVQVLSPLLGGFSFEMTLSTPGRVLKTDAPSKTPTSATWQYDFDRDPNALWALKTRNMTVVFDGKGLELTEIRPASPNAEPAQEASAPPAAPPPDAKSGS